MTIKEESTLMKLFLRLGQDSLAWSFRRLHIPVKKDALVLEVGSGSNPYFRANVLLDAYEVTQERHWTPLVKDRPTVLGYVENLPFRDQSFDFIIASHVLEHSTNPDKFLSELMRVGKAGYIEVPHAFGERISSYYDHRLELMTENGVLKIWKKKDWLIDKQLMNFFRNKPIEVLSPYLISRRPFHFHVRLYWEKEIKYEIMNPEIDISWKSPKSTTMWSYDDLNFIGKLKTNVLRVIRSVFSQKKRNRKINLLDLVRCHFCHSEKRLEESNVKTDEVVCKGCGGHFRHAEGFVDLITKN